VAGASLKRLEKHKNFFMIRKEEIKTRKGLKKSSPSGKRQVKKEVLANI
jgi:hypothetical protein